MLRKLSNALVAGQVFALLLSQLIFLLNPHLSWSLSEFSSVASAMAMTYGLVAALGFWVGIELLEVFRNRDLRPAWLSFRILTWLFTVGFAACGALYWHNLVNLRLFLPELHLRSVAIAATVVSTAAAILLLLGIFHYSFGRRVAWLGYVLFATALCSVAVAPILLRPPVEDPVVLPRLPLEDRAQERKLTILGIEGASLSYVLPAVAEGALPNFARLIESGASGTLRTLYPNESLAVWTSIATGTLPRQHGLFGFYEHRFPRSTGLLTLRPLGIYFEALEQIGIVERRTVSSSHRRAIPFWSILNQFGVPAGLVRWWGTYPAEGGEGFVVSEYLHRQILDGIDPPLEKLTHPPELAQTLAEYFIAPSDIPDASLDAYIDRSIVVPGDSFPWEYHLRSALSADLSHHAMASALKERINPQVMAVYYFGLDRIGHYFMRFQQPESFGDVSEAELAKYGRVVDAYYRQLDAILGEYLQEREPDEILLVLSGHGMEPLSILRRIIEPFKGNPNLSGYHDQSPEGMVIINGAGIAEAVRLQDASVVDVAPTILYLMGLPLGRDMDGIPMTGAFDEELTRNQPITFISSYKNFLIEPRGTEDSIAIAPLLPDWEEIPD